MKSSFVLPRNTRFRFLLEQHGLCPAMQGAVNLHLKVTGIRVVTDTLVDATIIHEHSSTKNEKKKRHPAMHLLRESKQWYFGLKAHIGVDPEHGHVHSAATSAATPISPPQAAGTACGRGGFEGRTTASRNTDNHTGGHNSTMFSLERSRSSSSQDNYAPAQTYPKQCWLFLLFATLFSTLSYAQSSSIGPSTLNAPHSDTSTGPPQAGTVEHNAHEQLSLGTGSLSLFIPVLSLPQRGGRTLNLGYVHSSNTWAAKETSVTWNQYGTANGSNPQTWWLETYATVEYVPTVQAPWYTSLHPNIPTLNADFVYMGATQMGTGAQTTFYPSYCVTGWTFTDWQGSSHSFRGYRDCTSTLLPYGQNMTPTESADDSGYQLDTTTASDLKVVAPDGVLYHFAGYKPPPNDGGNLVVVNVNVQLNYYASPFSQMVDPNGNTVSFSNWTLTDTTGRQVSLMSNNMSWIYQASPASTPTIASVKRTDSNSGISVPFPVNSVTSCQAKPYLPSGPSAAGYSGPHFVFTPPPTTYSYSTTMLALPDGSYYQLTYDSINRLTIIRYPGGGYTRYDYGDVGPIVGQSQDEGDMMCNHQRSRVIAKHECTLSSGGCSQSPTATWQSCQAGVGSGGEATTCYVGYGMGGTYTVIDPLLNNTVYGFSAEYLSSFVGGPGDIAVYIPPLELWRKTFSAGSSTPLGTVDTAYAPLAGCPMQGVGTYQTTLGENCLPVPSSWKTTYNDGSPVQAATTTQQTQYPHLATLVQQQDFAGNVVRSTSTVYASGGIYGVTPANPGGLYHIFDHVQSETSTDSVQSLSKNTANSYDTKGSLIQVDVSGTNAATATTKYTRDGSGNISLVQDPMQTGGGQTGSTAISYADQNVPGCPHSSNVGLPTLITNALNQSTAQAYYPTGPLACTKDANGNITTYAYDSMGRLSETDTPDGGQSTHLYTSSPPLQVTTTQKMNSSQTAVYTTTLDGFARPVQSVSVPAPGSQVCTETYYDADGRIAAVDDPNASCPSPFGTPMAAASVSFAYDGLGRKTLQTNEDGSTQRWAYFGSSVSFTDEASHQWLRTSDALGRLAKVVEPNAGRGQAETDYAYDGFGGLWSVNQLGVLGESVRSRGFSYDGLSRLITAGNPEVGTICFGQWNNGNCVNGYDRNGNLLHKTDARGVTTNYSYDALNRLLSKTYTNDPSGTASSCYQYDASSVAGAGGNMIGRLTNAWTQPGACPAAPGAGVQSRRSIFSYDAMGRVWNEQQCTRGTCGSTVTHPVAYGYDLAGNVTSHTNGIGTMTFFNCYDAANRLALVASSSVPCSAPNSMPSANLFSAPSYSPAGGLTGALFGTGLQLRRTYDNRLRVNSETDMGLVVPSPVPGSATVTIPGFEQIKP